MYNVCSQEPSLLSDGDESLSFSDQLAALILKLSESLSLETVLEIVTAALQRLLQADRVFVCRATDEGQGTIVAEAVTFGCSSVLGDIIASFDCLQQGILEEKWRNIQRFDNLNTTRFADSYRELFAQHQAQAALYVPIIVGEKWWGVLSIEHCSQSHVWHAQEIHGVGQVGRHLAIALGRAAHIQKQQQDVEELQYAAQVLQEKNYQLKTVVNQHTLSTLQAQAQLANKAKELEQTKQLLDNLNTRAHCFASFVLNIRQSLQLESAYQITVEEVRQCFQTDRVLLCRIDPSGRGIVMAEAVSSDWPSLANRELPSHLLAYYCQETSLAPFISTQDTEATYTDTLPMLLQTLQRWRVKAEVVVPLKHSATLWGFIIIHQCRSTRRWDTADMQCLLQAALHISISIEQTELQRKNQELLEVHRKAEQMLCVQQEQITHVLSSSPGILYSCLAQNNYQRIFFGKNLEELLGYSVFEAIETDFWIHHIHPEDLPNVQFCSTQPNLSQEYRIRHQDGTYRWLYDQQKVVFDDHGVPLEWIGYLVDITERKQVEEQLKRSLREKDVLLREIHHRVKNNLNVIIGLLNLQASYVEDSDVVEMFTHSKNRIRTMALLHEQLYRSEDLGRIEVSSYIEQLVNNLAAAYEDRASEIEFCLNVVPVALNIETAIPCGLLINELVTNSFKYAFPEGQAGRISITLAWVNQHLHLTIQDNGIGLPPTLDIQSCPSLGLRLVRLLALQLGAEFTLDKRSIGTCFHLVFSELAYDARL